MEQKHRKYVEITEEDVKKIATRFLKYYYRFRPRSMEAIISADVRGMGGIVADGYLAFPQDDGQIFVATLEATSADTRHEVQYSVKVQTLNWDAGTIALVLIVILRVWAHEAGWYLLNDLGPWLWWLGLFGATLLVAFIYKFLARSLRRYRYIHAVEQFKQYHADDQWIAISDNVFPSTEHTYFKELRRQCIKYGFGLIIIDRDFHPHLYITPAKQDQFKNQRSSVDFVTQNEWLQQIQDSRFMGYLREKLPWLFKMKKLRGARKRFRQTHLNHLVILFFCLAALGGVFYRQWEDRPIDYQGQKDYTMARLEEMQNKSLEPMIYLLDSTEIWPFKKNMRPYIGFVWENEEERINQLNEIQRDSDADIIVNVGDNEFVHYDCARFFNLGSKKYLIQEGLYPDLEEASSRMYELSLLGVKAHTIWAGCFMSDQTGYIVYLDELYNSLEEASLRADQIQDDLSTETNPLKLYIKVVYPRSEID